MRLSVLVLLSFTTLSLAIDSSKKPRPTKTQTPTENEPEDDGNMVRAAWDAEPTEYDKNSEVLGLEVTHAIENCERRTKEGDKIRLHWVGIIGKTGKWFASTYKKEKPGEFRIGSGKVIKGLDDGVRDMCVGEKRKLIVPPKLGHGFNRPVGPIMGGSTLIFEIELLDILDEPEEEVSEEIKNEEIKEEKKDEL